MYCAHFGLHRPPFNNTPDPSFYFGTAEHEEALATLEYATTERKGFVLLTGEVGAGKTLVGRMFLRRIESRARTAVITHTQLSGRQLMAALCSEFELPVAADASNLQLAERLQAFLLDQFAQDRLVVVLLDEAQNLPDESFEAVRMLGNLESDDAKLIQFCVLGQPELRVRFEQPGMRQLNQRLFRRFHLQALSRSQTGDYIRHRMKTAGWTGSDLFTEAAIERIFHESKGTPRLINRVCDNALLTAYGRGERVVDADIIDEVALAQADGPASQSRQRPWLEADAGENRRQRGERNAGAAASSLGTRRAVATAPQSNSAGGTGRRDETRGTVRPWLDAGRSLADYRNRVQSVVDEVSGRCDAMQERVDALKVRLGESERDIRGLVQRAAEGLAALNAQVKDLESRCASAAEIERVRAECSTGMADLLRRIDEEAEGLESLKQAFAAAMEQADGARRAGLEEGTRRLESQVASLQRLEEEVSKRDAGIQERIELLAGQIARSGGKVDELRGQMVTQKSEMEALASGVASRLDGLTRDLIALREGAITREELEQVRSEQHEEMTQIEGQHAEAIAGIQNDLTQHENVVQDLGRQVRARMTAIEEAVSTLRDTSATAQAFENLRTEQSAALADMARRITEESEALERLQTAVSQVAEAAPGDREAARAELSQQILAQARRVRDLRHRLARMHAAIEGRLDGLGRELAALRAEVATRKDLEQAQAEQSASLDGLKDEHARAVADIHSDLAHQEHAFRDLNRTVRERIMAIESGVNVLKSTAASREDIEQLRSEQVEALSGVDRRLSEREGAVEALNRQIGERMADFERLLSALRASPMADTEVERLRAEQAEALASMDQRLSKESDGLIELRQTLEQQTAVLSGGQRAIRAEVLRRMLNHAQRLRQLRNQLGQARVVVEGRLEGLSGELTALRRDHLRAVEGLQGDLKRQEGAVADLGRQVGQRVTTIEQAIENLRETSASGSALEQLRADMATRQELERAQKSQSVALHGAVNAHMRAVADIRSELAQHEGTVEDLGRQLKERMATLEQELCQTQAGTVSEQEKMENLRAEHAVAVAEMDRRLTLEAEALVELKRELHQRCGDVSAEQAVAKEELEKAIAVQAFSVDGLRQQLGKLQTAIEARMDGLAQDVHSAAQMLAELGGQLGTHEREIRALDERIEVRLGEARRALEVCQERSAPREELDALRASQAAAINEMGQRLSDEAEQLRQIQEAMQQQSAALAQEHQAGLAQLSERVGLQAGRVRRLNRRLREGQQALETRLAEMEQRFAARADVEAIRAQIQDDATELRERLKLQRQATESLISGVVQRCRAVQEQIDALATSKADAGEVAALSAHQQQATAELLSGLEQQKSAVQARFDQVFAQWQRTENELALLTESAAPAAELAALRELQERDTRQTLEALAAQRGELEGLLEDVRRRCDELSTRLAVLPDDLEAVRREHAEQIRSVCARMDTGRSQMDAALVEVSERCRQAEEQIQLLAARAASTEDVAEVRERHARDLNALLERLNRTDSDQQQVLSDLHQRWDQLAQGVCSVAASAAPASSFTALEQVFDENMNEIRAQMETTHQRYKDDLRSMVWTIQQLGARVAAVEAADRPAPVKIELNPEAGRNLAELTENARRGREEIVQATQHAVDTQRALTESAKQLDVSLEQWRAGAAGVDQKTGELRASVYAAGELLKSMQRAQRILDEKINSNRWQEELNRGEALVGRLERAAGEAKDVCGRLHAALRDVDGCREEADAWTARCAEVRQLAGVLSKLLKAGRKAGDNLELELESRKHMLAEMAKHTAGLVDVIETARRAEGSSPAGARRFRPEPAVEDTPASRIDWSDVLETAERLAGGVTVG